MCHSSLFCPGSCPTPGRLCVGCMCTQWRDRDSGRDYSRGESSNDNVTWPETDFIFSRAFDREHVVFFYFDCKALIPLAKGAGSDAPAIAFRDDPAITKPKQFYMRTLRK